MADLYLFWVQEGSVPIMGTMKKAIATQEYRNLIAWLKQARQNSGMTMRELAQILDKPHSFVQKVEIQERVLDIYEYTVYCEALQLDPRDGLSYLKKEIS